MKRKIISCAALAFFLFTSASMWEGSAAVATGSDLPEKGFFVATNSFPRNTVIDLTNLENNKSVRVIVAGTLETPGLLALVSREAANTIGMNPNSISRIRMIQPTDPAAYFRFTEDMDGITFYDSGDVITEEKYRESLTAPNRPGILAAPGMPDTSATRPSTAYPFELEWEPDWARSADFADLLAPEYELPPPAPALREALPPKFAEEEIKPEVAEALKDEVPKTEPALIEEPVIAQTPQVIDEKKPETTVAEAEPEQRLEDLYKYTLVPAPQRPPESSGVYGIDPSSIIPGITRVAEPAPKVETKPPFKNNYSFESLLVPNLTAGCFYVQIASLQTPELIEGVLNKIDTAYREVVRIQKSGQSSYRILLGPLNQGESAAVLKRFKSIGYKDAVIRKG